MKETKRNGKEHCKLNGKEPMEETIGIKCEGDREKRGMEWEGRNLWTKLLRIWEEIVK